MTLHLVYRYIISRSKNENMLKKAKRRKKGKRKISSGGSRTRTFNTLSIAPQQLLLNKTAKLIIFKLFLPMKFCRRTLFEAVTALFLRN